MSAQSVDRSGKGEKLAQRLSLILARLHQGDVINKHALAREFDVDVRTIERDLGERLVGIVQRDADGLWGLTHGARSTVPAKDLHGYASLSGTERLFPDTSLRYLLAQLSIPESHRGTQVQATPYENLDGATTFAALQEAVQNHYHCRFDYRGKPRHVAPYRLIHKNGIWYLAAEEGEQLKNFSVALIDSLAVDKSSQFAVKRAHLDYMDAKDDVWFTAQTTEVLLRVAQPAAHYFSRRPLLPRQQQRADDKGGLLVTAHISHIDQLLPVVRYWLPHVRILAPTAWHEQLMTGLRQTLAQWEE